MKFNFFKKWINRCFFRKKKSAGKISDAFQNIFYRLRRGCLLYTSRSRLLARKQAEYDAEYAARRKSQVGTGDRSERIRTYNFPQGRLTDHRIGLTLYKLDAVMNGDLDEVVEALVTADQAEKLKAASGDE